MSSCGINSDTIKKAIVKIPAIAWFSVILEANIPTEIAAPLININPNIVTSNSNMLGFPKKHSIPKYINDITNDIIITSIAAKNLPNTTLVIPTGDVNINCSVPVFLSSANILIVNIGTVISNPQSAT